jgi:YbbR domain-containing protein
MTKLLRHLFFDDLPLKLFSLVLALLFWLTVAFVIRQKEGSPGSGVILTTSVRTFFNLPVAVLSSAGDVRNYKVSPNQVEVTVQGDPHAVNNLQSNDIRVIVDLTGIEATRNLRRRIEVSTPAGVTHVGVRPEEVQIMIPSKTPQR